MASSVRAVPRSDGALRHEGWTLGSAPVLFPTIQFAIFFPIVFVLSWLLRPYPTPVEAADGDRQLHLLRLVGLALLSSSSAVRHDREPDVRSSASRPCRDAGASGSLLHRRGRPSTSASLALLQVLRLLRHLDRRTASSELGVKVSPPLFQIILPIGISFFTFQAMSYVDRRLPRQRRSRSPLLDFAVVPLVLPAPRRRPDRAGRRVPAAAARAARPALPRRRARVPADRRRPVQEGRDLELPRQRDRRPGLRRAGQPQLARDPLRHLRLRDPDLRRLQRLHRHRDRGRAAARHPLPAELRLAVPALLAAGLLAALAHDACRAGCATTSTSRSAATAAAGGGRTATSC